MIPFKFQKTDITNYVFWTPQGKSFDVNIEQFLALLNHLGFYKIILNENQDNEIKEVVHIENHTMIVTRYKSEKDTLSAIRESFFDYLRYNREKIREEFKIDINKLIDAMAKKQKTIFQLEHFDTIPAEKNLTFYKDSKDTAYFFFKKSIEVVTQDGVVGENYVCEFRKDKKRQNWCVWKKDIIDFDFDKLPIQDYVSSPFFDFVLLLTTEKETENDKLENAISSLGYLMHSYKNPSVPKMIIITETNITDKAEGGTGKGILINAIGKLRKVADIDGKSFDAADRFKFQNVTADTKIIWINDAKEHLALELLYNAITDSLAVERKNKDRSILSFEESPKLVLTTNHDVKGFSTSDNRRKHYVELQSVFNANFQPIDHFGHLFFRDWNKTQWNQFYNFMLHCVSTYLANGLKEYKSDTLIQKQIIKAVGGTEFYDWLEELPKNDYYEFDFFVHSFEETFGKNAKFSSKKAIASKIRKYAEMKGLEYIVKERKFSDERGYGLFEKKVS